jgi:hypothetical protein
VGVAPFHPGADDLTRSGANRFRKLAVVSHDIGDTAGLSLSWGGWPCAVFRGACRGREAD